MDLYKIWHKTEKRYIDLDKGYLWYEDIAIDPRSGKVLGYSVNTGSLDVEIIDELEAVYQNK
mgnify:CR=1 FL=1